MARHTDGFSSTAFISFVFFVDDCLLFMQNSSDCVNILLEVIGDYERALGQRINTNKSSIFFSKKIPLDQRLCITQRFDMQVSSGVGKYLGLPYLIGRSKTEVFAYLKERVWKKTHGWKEKLLSKRGKEILIKSVLQAIPTYAMSVFKLPMILCKELQGLTRKFGWNSGAAGHGMAWVSWTKMCRPKQYGVLGFENFHIFNQALLAKQAWNLATNTTSLLARVLRSIMELFLPPKVLFLRGN